MLIGWTLVYTIDASPSSRSHPTPITTPRVLHLKSQENIIAHGRKKEKGRVKKVGQHNASALLPQYYNQGPLTHGPFTCQPSHTATWCHLGVRMDSRGPATCPRHLDAVWARTALPRGLVCHVASVWVPRAMSAPRVLWR